MTDGGQDPLHGAGCRATPSQGQCVRNALDREAAVDDEILTRREFGVIAGQP
jgi:hypothetical protein